LMSILVWLAPPCAIVILSIRFSAGVSAALLNFCEHGLVDPADPQNVYRSASTVQIQGEDHGSLGSDLHIAHHLHPGRHWSLLVEEARAGMSRYLELGVIVYRSNESIVRDLLRHRFDHIAAHCVLDGMKLEELAAEIRRRASPSQQTHRHPLVHRTDEILGRIASRVLI
jgi:hypothetical protein